jgi:hypothetical protein
MCVRLFEYKQLNEKKICVGHDGYQKQEHSSMQVTMSLRCSKPSLELTYFPRACEATESTGVSNTIFAASRQKIS